MSEKMSFKNRQILKSKRKKRKKEKGKLREKNGFRERELKSHPMCKNPSIETHKELLIYPPDDQLIYKVISVENFLDSLKGSYLYFNRVDSYKDFPGADKFDGQQLPQDLPGNQASAFVATSKFTAADYYNQSRSRTYACCFSTKNTEYIWKNYGGKKEKICLVFKFRKFKSVLNSRISKNTKIVISEKIIRDIFDLNYGLVKYIDFMSFRSNYNRLQNPIHYTYYKDNSFREESEFRVSLSALGIGNFVLSDGSFLEFEDSLRPDFYYNEAKCAGALINILIPENFYSDELREAITNHGLSMIKTIIKA